LENALEIPKAKGKEKWEEKWEIGLKKSKNRKI